MTRTVASSAQCRAARALLSWTQLRLATEAGVARKTVADFELGNRTLHRRTRRSISAALEEAGVAFMDDGPDHGEGVRFADKARAAVSTTGIVRMSSPQSAGQT